MFNPAEQVRLRTALQDVAHAVAAADLTAISASAGLTGYGAPVADQVSALMVETFGVAADAIVLMDDIVLAYLGHFGPGEGHLISAGTGSIGVHVTAAGATIRVGGRGILIDDAGSGSWIALTALDRIYRALDHDGSFAQAGLLAHHVFDRIGGSQWHDVREFVYGGDRGRIGTLAVAVAQAAQAGDETALAILRQAGAELAQLATALLRRAGRHPVRVVGGVLELHPIIFEEMTRCLPGQDVRRAEGDAALAAAGLQTHGRHAL